MGKSGQSTVKRRLAEFLVRHVEKLLPMGMVLGALSAFFLILFVSIFLSKNTGRTVADCGCVTDRFENISSFMEVMIALYAISTVRSICNKVKEVINIGESFFYWVFRGWKGALNVTEHTNRQVSKQYLREENELWRRCDAYSRRFLLVLGFIVSLAMTCLLVLGMGDAVKPFMLLAAAPILMYISSLLAYHVVVHVYSAVECYMASKPLTEEEIKAQNATDMAIIMDCCK